MLAVGRMLVVLGRPGVAGDPFALEERLNRARRDPHPNLLAQQAVRDGGVMLLDLDVIIELDRAGHPVRCFHSAKTYGVCGSGLSKLFLCGLAGTLIRFEGNAWHKDFTGVRSDLHSVAHLDGVFYAVGSNGTALRNSDGLWEMEKTPTGVALQSLAATEAGVYACGANGVVLRRRC